MTFSYQNLSQTLECAPLSRWLFLQKNSILDVSLGSLYTSESKSKDSAMFSESKNYQWKHHGVLGQVKGRPNVRAKKVS